MAEARTSLFRVAMIAVLAVFMEARISADRGPPIADQPAGARNATACGQTRPCMVLAEISRARSGNQITAVRQRNCCRGPRMR